MHHPTTDFETNQCEGVPEKPVNAAIQPVYPTAPAFLKPFTDGMFNAVNRNLSSSKGTNLGVFLVVNDENIA
jgi:hypothetical protein